MKKHPVRNATFLLAIPIVFGLATFPESTDQYLIRVTSAEPGSEITFDWTATFSNSTVRSEIVGNSEMNRSITTPFEVVMPASGFSAAFRYLEGDSRWWVSVQGVRKGREEGSLVRGGHEVVLVSAAPRQVTVSGLGRAGPTAVHK